MNSVSSRATRRVLVHATLIVALVGGLLVSVSVGQLEMTVRGVLGTLASVVGFDTSWNPADELVRETLLQIRFPRVVMSVLVGASLAVSGAVMQAIFGNPLAEPGVVGVSSGAAVGAAVALAWGGAFLGELGVAAAGFVGGLISTFFVYFAARNEGRTEVVTLLLMGIAVNAFAGAALAFVLFSASSAAREQIVFWQLGSINGSRWDEVVIISAVSIPAMLIAIALASRFDLLTLGERTARHLGLNVELLRIVSVGLVALLTAVGVAFVGIISFVGLVVPHAIRMLIGPAHRPLLLSSAVGGAALLVWADFAARTLVSGVDLPIGMLTALVGGPFFFYLVRSARSRSGGWS